MNPPVAAPSLDTADEALTADPTVSEAVVDQLVDDELLVEEISIDGMCGVY